MQDNNNLYAPPQAEVADVQGLQPAPPLWNPGAAAGWSLLFTPIFGAMLHRANWEAMGEPEKAAVNTWWIRATIAFLVLTLVFGAVLPESGVMDAISRFGGIGLLVAWYYHVGKSQQALVLARYGKGYPRKPWGKPLGLGVLAYLGIVVIAVGIVAVAGLAGR